MDRRTFLRRSALLAAGGVVVSTLPAWADLALKGGRNGIHLDRDRYLQLQNPDAGYRPFVRWWWNGNKVDQGELNRELGLLHSVGIGGVEINPVKFPELTPDLGLPALTWLSEEWIDRVRDTCLEAHRLGLTCDLIVGSGWPFGAEYLEGDERGQVVVIATQHLTGPTTYTTSRFTLFHEADPGVNNPYAGRTPHLRSLHLVPDPMQSLEEAINLSDQVDQDLITVEVPAGDHVLYALVQFDSFMEVINGVPGANGPTLNHLNQSAVKKYLCTMSERMESRMGPMKTYLRALFIDGMELEGANWTSDMAAQFHQRNGYDLIPYLPFILFKTGSMGNVTSYTYGATFTPILKATLDRVRYDFERTKAEMFHERFILTFETWCRDLGVKSRVQGYGRGFFPLESNMHCDIPEGESWTTNYLQHRIGEEMPNEDYRRGRAYTMINKYVSSGAHLTGRRMVSCEEMTDTYRVFNTSLEFLKLGSDQSILSGITHSVLHGFNYSPPQAAFPGWVRYGCYYNEQNNWWPHLHHLTDYKGRLSALLCKAEMQAEIAILPPQGDLWTQKGVQSDPFPSEAMPPWMTLVWEAMSKHGNCSDYVSEPIIRASTIHQGALCYNNRRYTTLFLVDVTSIEPGTLERLHTFVSQGGRVFCVNRYPDQSLGLRDWDARQGEVHTWVERLRNYPARFVLLPIPEDRDFMTWYASVQQQHHISSPIKISSPNPYLMQIHYQTDDGAQIFFLANAHLHNSHRTQISFLPEITRGRHAWVWDMDKGDRYRIDLRDNSFEMDFGPTESLLLVFDGQRKGPQWSPLRSSAAPGTDVQTLHTWAVTLEHSRLENHPTIHMEELYDLKGSAYEAFTGTAIYRTQFTVDSTVTATPLNPDTTLNLGKVHGVSDVFLNGVSLGATWYGRRLYDLTAHLRPGSNALEVRVTTSMGNYMKTLIDNPVAQKWTVLKSKDQPIQSMGLVGPVQIY